MKKFLNLYLNIKIIEGYLKSFFGGSYHTPLAPLIYFFWVKKVTKTTFFWVVTRSLKPISNDMHASTAFRTRFAQTAER
jgi:hypothetical protein